ncbi:EAL-associated domain-containing protein [Bacillus licheniformis]|nr:EAL-associated domain-containing protein [Bacillus licheniformis]
MCDEDGIQLTKTCLSMTEHGYFSLSTSAKLELAPLFLENIMRMRTMRKGFSAICTAISKRGNDQNVFLSDG